MTDTKTDLPAPLVPDDVDLRDFPFMPLDVARLRDSKIVDAVTGDEFKAAVLLWCAAWHQVPAASLPDDDAQLAKFAGYGRFVKQWLKVKRNALYGFILCSDGRLYHPVVAEKAHDAWAMRRSASSRGKKGAEKRWQKDKQNQTGGDSSAKNSDGSAKAQAMANDSNRQGQREGQEQKQKQSITPVNSDTARACAMDAHARSESVGHRRAEQPDRSAPLPSPAADVTREQQHKETPGPSWTAADAADNTRARLKSWENYWARPRPDIDRANHLLKLIDGLVGRTDCPPDVVTGAAALRSRIQAWLNRRGAADVSQNQNQEPPAGWIVRDRLADGTPLTFYQPAEHQPAADRVTALPNQKPKEKPYVHPCFKN